MLLFVRITLPNFYILSRDSYIFHLTCYKVIIVVCIYRAAYDVTLSRRTDDPFQILLLISRKP